VSAGRLQLFLTKLPKPLSCLFDIGTYISNRSGSLSMTKLCKHTHASIIDSTVDTAARIGRRKMRHFALKIPKLHSIVWRPRVAQFDSEFGKCILFRDDGCALSLGWIVLSVETHN
jgi:hypothetical protein